MPPIAVRVGKETYRVLRALAEARSETLQRTLADAIESYRRTRFLEAANEAFSRLRNNETMWQHETAERALWSGHSGDTAKHHPRS